MYQQAQQAGKKASLLEQERPNIFTISVANIGPGEAVVVDIEYQEVVRYDQGEFRLRFPMVVGPRYVPGTDPIPGAPGTGWGVNTTAVPDAERITPPVRHPAEGVVNPLSLAVELDAGFALRRLASPYHAIVTTPVSATRHSITLVDGVVPADRDFELVWAPDPGTEPAAAVFTEWHGGEPYALVMLLPPAAPDAAGGRLSREVIFVVDTSGSMAAASIQQARLALEQALAALTPGDRFNVIQFNSRTEQLFPASVPAGPAEVERARWWVQTLQANGGTEMVPALRAALEGVTETGVVRQVVTSWWFTPATWRSCGIWVTRGSRSSRTSRSTRWCRAARCATWCGPRASRGALERYHAGQKSDQLARQGRPGPRFLVLEVHERVAPLGPRGRRRPRPELVRPVGAVAEAQVAEVRRHDDGRGALLGVGDAEGRVPGAEDAVHLLVEPRRVAKLDGHADGRRHQREAVAKTAGILPEVRRQLEEKRTELRAEPSDRVEEIPEGLSDVAQAGEVGDPLRDLEGETNPAGLSWSQPAIVFAVGIR